MNSERLPAIELIISLFLFNFSVSYLYICVYLLLNLDSMTACIRRKGMWSSHASRDSESKNPPFYCRKEKSLSVLCSNFLKQYNKDGVDSIGVDHAAFQLGVERRRIYDIVNIPESVGVSTLEGK
nr:E2F transcription factor-like E2FF [Coffea arabica]